MRAALDNWLGKPATVHFLRCFVNTVDQCARSQTRVVRWYNPLPASRNHATETKTCQNESNEQGKLLGLSTWRFGDKGKHILNPAELGLQMSINSGVPILDKDGQHAFSELKFQSNVNSKSAVGKLLVDDPEHRQNAGLWLEILRFRHRLDGLHGVADVWLGLRRRNVDLTASGAEADILWTTFINAGITGSEQDGNKYEQLLSEIFEYVQNHCQHARVWVELLHFRHRMSGFEGIHDVWHIMRKRGVDIPVSGTEGDVLWTTFIHAGIIGNGNGRGAERQFLSEIFEYAKDLKARSGSQYHALYKRIVGRLFRVRSTDVRDWHYRLVKSGLAEERAISDVAIDAMLNENPGKAFHSFTQIYKTGEARNLYDSCISEALNLNDEVVALRWHRLFLKNGDGPSTEMFSRPAVQRLFSLDNDASLPMKRSTKERDINRKTVEIDALKAKLPPMTRQTMNTLVGDVYGIKPKEISDNFCARLIATRAFSTGLVAKGLSFLGIETLGPLAIREMAIRAGSPVEMSNQIMVLRDHGVRFGNSIYARIVTRLVNEGHTRLWHALLASDQHPEEFESATTQELLLTSYLERQNWGAAHVTLLALSFIGSASQIIAWNRILQYYITHQDYRSMLDTTQTMQMQNLSISTETLKLMRQYVLPPRGDSKRPIAGLGPNFFEPLDFVRNTCIYSAGKGRHVPMGLWLELLKRYGLAWRWDATERLVLWLFNYYLPNSSPQRGDFKPRTYMARRRLLRERHDLRLMFGRKVMIHSLLTWGFRSASFHNELQVYPEKGYPGQCEPWARGLTLLKRLRSHMLFDITPRVRQAFQQRMWMLFGLGYSVRGYNNHARVVNQLSLAHYIRHANDIWSGLVDWVDPELLDGTNDNNPQLLTELFGPVYLTDQKMKQYADVEAWAAALGNIESTHINEPFKVPVKKAMWERSTFRLNGSEARKRTKRDEGVSRVHSEQRATYVRRVNE